jgi:hypothetical protein
LRPRHRGLGRSNTGSLLRILVPCLNTFHVTLAHTCGRRSLSSCTAARTTLTMAPPCSFAAANRGKKPRTQTVRPVLEVESLAAAGPRTRATRGLRLLFRGWSADAASPEARHSLGGDGGVLHSSNATQQCFGETMYNTASIIELQSYGRGTTIHLTTPTPHEHTHAKPKPQRTSDCMPRHRIVAPWPCSPPTISGSWTRRARGGRSLRKLPAGGSHPRLYAPGRFSAVCHRELSGAGDLLHPSCLLSRCNRG